MFLSNLLKNKRLESVNPCLKTNFFQKSGAVFFLTALACRLFSQIPDSLPVPAVREAVGSHVFIDSITIEGNRKTRAALILRELEFAPGDSIPIEGLGQTLERNQLRLLNLGIFSQAKINVRRWGTGNRLALHIKVVEGWYLYPVPIFSLADRNFNVWWREFNHSLRRVNYGVDFSQLNFTGRADALKVKAQFGYSNTYEITYRSPAINPQQTLGLQTGVSYSRAHEVAVNTAGNKLVFNTNPDVWNIRRTRAFLGFTWRPKLLTTQHFTLEYHDNLAPDSIALILNPDFFGAGQTRQRHFSLVYTLDHDRRDIRPYPTRGWHVYIEVRQNGLLPADDLHLFRVKAEYGRYFPFGQRLSLETVGKVRTSLPRGKPPYYNNQALGYGGDYVRGYEYYVVDGLDFAVLRTSWHFLFFDREINFGRFMPLESFRILPLKLFLAFNNDLGFANDPHFAARNPLANRPLYGYGLGLDIVLYYNKTARIEWTRNDLGQSGFFVRINTGI